jgi:hypothetical protein
VNGGLQNIAKPHSQIDMYRTIGTRQTDLPQLFAALDNGDWDISDVYGSTGNKECV